MALNRACPVLVLIAGQDGHHDNMRAGLPWLLTVVLGTLLAAAWFYFVWEVLDQQECNRADCSWVGDVSYGTAANIPLGASFLVAAIVVWGTRGLVRRSHRR